MTDKATPTQDPLLALSENEQTAMEIYAGVKETRGDVDMDDPDEIAELASMMLNTVIHLGGIVERAMDDANYYRHLLRAANARGDGEWLAVYRLQLDAQVTANKEAAIRSPQCSDWSNGVAKGFEEALRYLHALTPPTPGSEVKS